MGSSCMKASRFRLRPSSSFPYLARRKERGFRKLVRKEPRKNLFFFNCFFSFSFFFLKRTEKNSDRLGYIEHPKNTGEIFSSHLRSSLKLFNFPCVEL